MGDSRFGPVVEVAKSKLDYVATGATALAFFKAIPWAEIAAAMACVYWLIKIFLAWKKRHQ